jgi:hypothetical protein
MVKLQKCHELRDRGAACVAPIKYSDVMALVARSIPKLPETAKILRRTKLLSLGITERCVVEQLPSRT